MNLLCKIGLHAWFKFHTDNDSRICKRCGKYRQEIFIGWHTQGYVTDPETIVAYFKKQKQQREEDRRKHWEKKERTILQAKDIVPSLGESKEEKA